MTLQRVLAMAAVSDMLIHLPWDGPVMIEIDLSNACVSSGRLVGVI